MSDITPTPQERIPKPRRSAPPTGVLPKKYNEIENATFELFAGGHFVDDFSLEFQPSDPVAATIGDDLHAGGGAFQEAAPVLTEPDETVAGVAVLQSEFGEDLDMRFLFASV